MRISPKEAGVSKRTLVQIERPQSVSEGSVARVRAALEARGVEFLAPENGQGPGIRIPEAALKDPAIR